MEQEFFDGKYVFRETQSLVFKIIVPTIIMITGIVALYFLDRHYVEGITYILLVLSGYAASLLGLAWFIITLYRHMKKSVVRDKIIINTVNSLKDKNFRRFYWVYGFASLIGLIIAIITENAAFLGVFTTIVLLLGIFLHAQVIIYFDKVAEHIKKERGRVKVIIKDIKRKSEQIKKKLR